MYVRCSNLLYLFVDKIGKWFCSKCANNIALLVAIISKGCRYEADAVYRRHTQCMCVAVNVSCPCVLYVFSMYPFLCFFISKTEKR